MFEGQNELKVDVWLWNAIMTVVTTLSSPMQCPGGGWEVMFAGVNVDIIVMTNPVLLEYFKSANWSVKCQNLLISARV